MQVRGTMPVRGSLGPRSGLAMIVAVALVLTACVRTDDAGSDGSLGSTPPDVTSSDDPASPTLPVPVQELDIDGADYTFEITPDPSGGLRPGWTLVRFHNVGAEAHQVMFARLKEGVDMGALAAAGAGDSSGAGAIEFVDMIGGVSYIGPGRDVTAMVNLTEGLTLAMCYVPDANGVAHALMGMSTALDVSAPDDPENRDAGVGTELVQGTIELSQDGYRLPDELRAGWYRVTNTDSVLHELSLLRLGQRVDDRELGSLVAALAANQAPEVDLEAVGGMGAISAGFEGYLYLDLAPGDYLAVDFMPDPGDPRPHLLDGYHATFSV